MTLADLAEELLLHFSFEELLEMNDIQEEESLLLLLEKGMISQPEQIIREFEQEWDI